MGYCRLQYLTDRRGEVERGTVTELQSYNCYDVTMLHTRFLCCLDHVAKFPEGLRRKLTRN